MSRGVWRIFAVAIAAVPAHARGARAARFLRRARARGQAAEGHGRVRARAGCGSRRATGTCSSTNFRTPAVRSGSSSRQLVKSWGEGFGAASDAHPAVDLHRRRPQAVDLRFPRRRRRGASTRRRASSRRCGRTASRGGRSRSASDRRRRSWRSSTTCSRRCRRPSGRHASRPRRVPVWRTAIGFRPMQPDRTRGRLPAERRARLTHRCASRLHRRRHGAATPPSAWPTRSSDLLAEARRFATADRRPPRKPSAADIAILFRSRDSHREFEAALERRGVPTYVYKGLGFFDADEIQDAVALLRYLADPLSDLRAARSCARASSACRTPPGPARLDDGRGHAQRRAAAGASRLLGDEDRPRARSAPARRAAMAGVGGPAGAVRAARRGAARNGVRVRAARRPAAAGAREPEEAARHDPPRPEPRLRDARPHRRPSRTAGGRRRVERGDRRASTPSA